MSDQKKTNTGNFLPKDFFAPLIAKAKALIGPKKIILFGSFARGDSDRTSDIDLAFDFNANHTKWVEFQMWVEEKLPTLREVDMINMDKIDDPLLNTILKEGIILYEK